MMKYGEPGGLSLFSGYHSDDLQGVSILQVLASTSTDLFDFRRSKRSRGGTFTLAELGVCEPPPPPPPHPAAAPYCPDLGLLQRGYSLSAGSDADSDPEGPLSPERAIQLWAGRGGGKSRRSSGVSSRENSALTLTDSDNDNKSDDESGRKRSAGAV
ncbi:Teneurin-2 [Liparis tanakae]|uniref:Teneurin-2 n=1 Tax=Liparis tanakae TaxID=230148 RepID=A0A4Z2FU52_9TELE|nr:Teneurin-2 [Liparis tanakae]